MFYKIAKTLSVTASIIGILMMAGACSVKSQELFYLYAALGITTLTTGAFALEYFRIREWQYRKRKIREAEGAVPEEKQRKSIRTAELDKMINKLRSLDRVDGTSEYYKNNAIAYLSDLANHLDRIGVKTIKMRPEVAASSGAHNKNTN